MSEYWKLEKRYKKNFVRAVKKLQENCDHEWGDWMVPFRNVDYEMRFCKICKLSEKRPISKSPSKGDNERE